MPARPRLLQRLALMVLSFALPALMLAVTGFCFFALTTLGNHDRTLAWVQGSPTQLETLRRSLEEHPVFRDGRLQAGAFDRHRPARCGPEMVSASFSRLHDFELSVAKATLDALVRESGATPCPAFSFVFNDLPHPLDPGEWDESIAVVLLVLGLPIGSLMAAYWACSAQFGLPRLLATPGPVSRWLPAALAAAGLALAGVALVGWLGPRIGAPPVTTRELLAMPSFSLPIVLVAAVYAPFLEEVAYRGWLLPIAERATGPLGAAALSAGVFALVRLPAGGYQAAGALCLGALLALLFLRTRSLPACLVAHGGFNAGALAWATLAAA